MKRLIWKIINIKQKNKFCSFFWDRIIGMIKKLLHGTIWWRIFELNRQHSGIVIKPIPHHTLTNLILYLFDTSFTQFRLEQFMLVEPIRSQDNLFILIFVESINVGLWGHVWFMFFVTDSSWYVQLSVDSILITTLEYQPTLSHDSSDFIVIWQIVLFCHLNKFSIYFRQPKHFTIANISSNNLIVINYS